MIDELPCFSRTETLNPKTEENYMEQYITETELSKKLQMSRTVIYQLRKEGWPFRRIHRTIRYIPEEIETWLATHEHENADTASRKIEGEI